VDLEEFGSVAPEADHLRRPAIAGTDGPARLKDASDPLERLASSVGNRGFTRTIARMRDGDGILPGGLVHPDVEAAIAASSGGGRQLDAQLSEQIGGALGDSFGDVRVHHDDHAAALSRAVSARAFTVGRDIFFGAGEYSPRTAGGRELLTHELAHVVQQRAAPQSGPLTVSEPGDALEREAEAAARGRG
jgi:Domain of unknown function (DUF4157)